MGWLATGGAREGSSPRQFTNSEAVEQILSGFLKWLIVTDVALAVLEPEAVAVHLKDVDVMGEAIEQRAG